MEFLKIYLAVLLVAVPWCVVASGFGNPVLRGLVALAALGLLGYALHRARDGSLS